MTVGEVPIADTRADAIKSPLRRAKQTLATGNGSAFSPYSRELARHKQPAFAIRLLGYVEALLESDRQEGAAGLSRAHICAQLSQAIDEVRAQEARELKAQGG